ncbi:hypothetical protein ACSS6W_002771 [Trichoderma asperelloides]
MHLVTNREGGTKGGEPALAALLISLRNATHVIYKAHTCLLCHSVSIGERGQLSFTLY